MMDEGLRVDAGAKRAATTEGGRKRNENKETRDNLRVHEPAQIADVCVRFMRAMSLWIGGRRRHY
jgi:hypothetical protein